MRSQALISFVLGAWLAGTLFMWSVATQNFRIVDRLLGTPPPDFTARAAPLAPGDARLLMRYQASEVNRLFFSRWGWVQLALAVILLWLVFSAPAARSIRIAVALMALVAAATQFGVVPETMRLGRALDFVPRAPAPPEAAPFWRLHAIYTALDLAKFGLGILVLASLLTRRSSGA